MKKMFYCFLLAFMFVLQGCNKNEDQVELPSDNTDDFSYEINKKIPIINLEIPYSKVSGSIEAFRRYNKPIDDFPLVFLSSELKSHQIIFSFDAIYPIKEMYLNSLKEKDYKNIKNIQIFTSIDGHNYKQLFSNYELNAENIIDFNGESAKSIKISFLALDDIYILNHIHFTLAKGMIIKERTDWSNLFLRYEGWTGADGIFSFNLAGKRELWTNSNNNLLIFSDTIIGDVYQHNNLRKNSIMINNSFAIFDNKQNIQFIYDEKDGLPLSVFLADFYMGKDLRNLLDGDGLNITRNKNALLTNDGDGTMFLTKANSAELELDFNDIEYIKSLYIWNYNDEINYGTKSFTIYYSNDNKIWEKLESYNLNMAANSQAENYHLELELNIETRYLKITLDESYDDNYIGLGKLMFFNDKAEYLFAEITGTKSNIEFSSLDKTGRLWLQDGLVIDNYFYTYSIYVKDYEDLFKVHSVGLIKVPIINNSLDYKNAHFLNTPLHNKTTDGGEIFFGAGVLDNTLRDGYVYLYGYKDLDGRNLIVSRFKINEIENFNSYEFYNGKTWTKNIEDVSYLKDRVSAELSVTYIPSGIYENKYMLVVMENTMGGKVSYAISDTPYDLFGEYHNIYQATEYLYLNKAFAYNAKLHPSLSTENSFLISYNVNTTNLGSLADVRIYYPRFIEMIEVKEKNK